MKRFLGLLIGILVSVAAFAWSMQGTSREELQAGFQQANYLTLPVMLLLLFGFYWLKAMRWSWLLAPVKPLSTKQLMAPLLIGFAANNILPAHLGEFVRVFVVQRKHKVPASTVLSTVVLERIFDVLAILALFSLGLVFTKDLPDEYRNAAKFLGIASAGVVLCVVVFLIWTEQFVRFTMAVLNRLPFVPEGLSNKLLEMLRSGAAGLQALRNGKALVLITASSLAQWLLNGMIAYTALTAFHIPVTPAAGLIVTGVTALGVTVPSTPGYFGVIQGCFKISMATLAVQPDPSLVLGSSLYYHLSMYIPVTLLGVYFLNSLGLSLRDLSHVADDSDTSDRQISDSRAEAVVNPYTPPQKV
ncbi:MAG: lysylphosphatidylglycerol synthase transmembrane domain-containing protein [Planctomycetaceae bacterium]